MKNEKRKAFIKGGISIFISAVAFYSAYQADSCFLCLLLMVSGILEFYLSIDSLRNEKKLAEKIRKYQLMASQNSKRIEKLENEESFVEQETLHLHR